nr:hypothetical protein [Cyanidioschyzonaceae sp. 2]
MWLMIGSYGVLLICVALVIGLMIYGIKKINQTKMAWWEKGLCLALYLLPILECMTHCGATVLNDYPWMRGIYKISLRPLVMAYSEYPMMGFMIFLLSYLLFVRGILKVRRIVRFHVSQALIIYLLNSIIGVLMNAIPEAMMMGWFGEMCVDILFIMTSGGVMYASYKVMKGEWTRIPLISEAAKVQVQGGEG